MDRSMAKVGLLLLALTMSWSGHSGARSLPRPAKEYMMRRDNNTMKYGNERRVP